MDLPQISIVVAAYNAEQTIEECLTSLIEQPVREIEIIVIDDGSTDATADIVSNFTSTEIPIRLYSQTNAGPSAARNHGVSKARADLIAFMDADDLSLPWRFTHMLKLAEHYPKVAAYLGFVVIASAPIPDEPEFSLEHVEELSLLDFAASDNLGGTSASLVRADAFRAVGGFDPQLWNGEDYELWTRLVAKYPIIRYKTPVLRFRSEVGSLSTNYDRCKPQVDALHGKIFGQTGVFSEHRQYGPILKAHQYDHLSWMAFREGKRVTALRLLATSFYNQLRGRLKVPNAEYPENQIPLLVRYLIGKPPGPGEH